MHLRATSRYGRAAAALTVGAAAVASLLVAVPTYAIAVESVLAAPGVPRGASGFRFSEDLFSPRMGQPALRVAGESFLARVALGGSYSVGQVQAWLEDVDGATHPLTVSAITAREVTPGSELDVMLYSPGLVTVQEVTLEVPAGTPAGFYGFGIDVAGSEYSSESAVRVYDEYPSSWGFMHITDTHVGYDDGTYTATERLQFFVQEANFLDPEFVVHTGDVCENQNAGHDWPQQFLGAVAELRVPIYVIPGNHDYYNDGQDYDPSGWLRYFHEINRYQNSRLEFGDAVFYGLDTQFNYGLLEFYRCHGPADEALDWLEAEAAGLGASDRPRFLLMHGPNFDYFSWNKYNTTRVRDIMNTFDFDLGLAGHTHRFETYLNSGTNSLFRNDFQGADDWVRDVAFPGYPLHTQTSSLGKDEETSAMVASELEGMGPEEAERVAAEMGFGSARELLEAIERCEAGGRGVFGDSITWRWVQVDGPDVAFYTADTDGDGYRNTETPWPLGEISFDVTTEPDGTIISTVTNGHYETWTDCRHYVPADPGMYYLVDGGTLLSRLPDGTAVVAVDAIAAQSSSVVTLSPTTGIDGDAFAFRLHSTCPNPFNPETRIAFELPEAADVSLDVYSVGGRHVARLLSGPMEAGPHHVTWDGSDGRGRALSSGVYFVRLQAGARAASTRGVLLK